jgi:hypothetical protein
VDFLLGLTLNTSGEIEAEEELSGNLAMDQDSIPFQL